MPDNAFTRWIPAYPGHLSRGDKVRVLHDAFASEAGRTIHNGRVGVVVAVASGDIIVKTTDDRKPALTEARYPYYKLEKAV
jgi:hypothetical protein